MSETSLTSEIRKSRGLSLKPCPRCGGEAETGHKEHWRGALQNYVYCTKCLISTEPYYSKWEEAAEAWNKRLDP